MGANLNQMYFIRFPDLHVDKIGISTMYQRDGQNGIKSKKDSSFEHFILPSINRECTFVSCQWQALARGTLAQRGTLMQLIASTSLSPKGSRTCQPAQGRKRPLKK